MYADRQGLPLLAAGHVGAAALIVLTLVVSLPGFVQGAIYLLLFLVVPGGSLLVIFRRASLTPLVAVVTAVVISVPMVMTATIVMAYLEIWRPVVIVMSIAVLSAIAGAVEAYHIVR